MRVFVAGATGAVGKRLLPLLVRAGHTVFGMTRSPDRAAAVRAAGAEAVVADALDERAVVEAVRAAAPQAIVHQLTAISPRLDLRRFDREFEPTNRLRTEGTKHLLEAARSAGVGRFVAQSHCGWEYAREGGPIQTEDDRLEPDPPPAFRRTLEAIRFLEGAVTEAGGLALRYGNFYGPGTSLGAGGAIIDAIRAQKLPLVGSGGGIWSFCHIDDAAGAVLAALERGAAGRYNIVDDEPAPVSDWLPELARAVGARPPRRFPAFLARLAIGRHGVLMMTENRGASNAKAKRELDWRPVWPSWRDGFRRGLG